MTTSKRSAVGVADASPQPPLAPAIDGVGILRMVGGNRKLLAEMVALFIQDYPKRVAEISSALGKNDATALEFAAHALKGAALTLCACRVAESAISIEKMARATELESVGSALVVLEQELAQAHAGLAGIVAA